MLGCPGPSLRCRAARLALPSWGRNDCKLKHGKINKNCYSNALIFLVKSILHSKFHDLNVSISIRMHTGLSGAVSPMQSGAACVAVLR